MLTSLEIKRKIEAVEGRCSSCKASGGRQPSFAEQITQAHENQAEHDAKDDDDPAREQTDLHARQSVLSNLSTCFNKALN